MIDRFVRCPHCKLPHDAAERVCPTTGRRIAPTEGRPSRMSELPPPERRPEPLGFAPTKNRRGAPSGEISGTLPPTRNLQADLVGRNVGGRYRVRGVLGEGGMGMVYDAEHIGLGRDVAIKVLSPSQAKKKVAVKRFQQEARAAGAIGHPNICEVYDLGQLDDGSPYLVMEKLVGSTLADRITREGGLPFDELVDVVIQVLAGLIAAHDKGIVHRDIKPENIFLARRVGCPPIVKILDFGVSKMMPQFHSGEEQLDLTRTGMVMGTPYYMSPEQARGERNLDGRVDVYACGVMMYEAIAGKRPFLAPNYNALLLAIISTTPKPLREVRTATPPALEAIVKRAMAKARDDRYPSASALLRDLQALAPSLAPVGVPSRLPAPPTAEERMRAPVLGGHPAHPPHPAHPAQPTHPSHPGHHAPHPAHPAPPPRAAAADARTVGPRRSVADPAEAAGATLRSGMTHSQTGRTDPATRLDIRRKAPSRPRLPAAKPDSDSIEIPIHITGSDLTPVSDTPISPARRPSRTPEYVDDVPTEIFRPGKHPAVPRAPQSASATKLSARSAPPATRPGASARLPDPVPLAPAPVDISALAGDEWEAATMVKRPEALAAHRLRAPQAEKPPAKPFNPDDTVAMEGNELDVEIDMSDDATIPPQRRR